MFVKMQWLAGACTLLLALNPVSAIPQLDRRQDAPTDPTASAAFSEAGIQTVKSVDPSSTQIIETAPPPPSILASVPPKPSPTPGGESAELYDGPAYLPVNDKGDLQPALSQQVTNGESTLGTLQADVYGQFLNTPGTPLPLGSPWADRTANKTNYYDLTQVPNTGKKRSYQFVITEQEISPDGVKKPGLVINGKFPGPTIEANWGDTIIVKVINKLNEGTALHWHGLLQKDTPYYDGVPSVMQCPIAPGSEFTYEFRADLYGTSWYHSHYSAQYAGGLLGAMIIHGPKNAPYDVDLGPVLLTDWYHDSYQNLVKQTMAPASANVFPPASNNNLINGKMNYPCQNTTRECTPNAGVSKFRFKAGKKHRLRLINASAESLQKFHIDGHKMTVIANDFVEVEPYEATVVTLGVGQRSDVIVEATGQSNDTYWMRSDISIPCSLADGISPSAVAAVLYDDADDNAVPATTSSATPEQLNYCGNDDLAGVKPFLPLTPDPNPPFSQDVNIVFTPNTTDPSTAFNVWEMNGVSFRGDFNDPILLRAKLGQTVFDSERNVYDFGGNSSFRLVVYNYFRFGPHPMHMHGHNVFVLAEGYGKWDGHVVNAGNPQRRDTQMVLPGRLGADGVTVEPAYVVLQVEADNPGVWPFHCHIAWHVSAGLYINVLERPKDITKREIPYVMAQTCRDWWKWTNANVVDQIDSGL